MAEKEKEIGKVTHWYDRVKVAVIDLKSPLKVGDRINVRSGSTEFEATVSSMQIDHESVTSAKRGANVAIELPQKAKEGATITLVG